MENLIALVPFCGLFLVLVLGALVVNDCLARAGGEVTWLGGLASRAARKIRAGGIWLFGEPYQGRHVRVET